MERSANAVWNGGLKEGSGKFSVQSGVISDVSYDYGKRFGDDPGTNPEELIAAAHAACFSMALGSELQKRGIVPESVATTATVTLEGGSVTKSHLKTVVTAPGADSSAAEDAWNTAKSGCPISKSLRAEVTLDAKLVG
jgi:osmotically inducible protein OsmC